MHITHMIYVINEMNKATQTNHIQEDFEIIIIVIIMFVNVNHTETNCLLEFIYDHDDESHIMCHMSHTC